MNLTVSASPHIRGKDTTSRRMLDVVIALLPALAAGVLFHGPRAALVAAVCVLSALAGEWSSGSTTPCPMAPPLSPGCCWP